MNPFTPEVIAAAGAHAKQQFPKESCGLVVNGKYVPCDNIAADPEQDFEISPKIFAFYSAQGGVEAVIHSHPDGPLCPTAADMEGQVRTGLPWAIIPLMRDGDFHRVGEPIVWGLTDRPPLIGRQFVHGVTDCYALIRDIFAAGKDRLKEEGVTSEWPFDPIELPEGIRDDGWWNDGKDLYLDNIVHLPFVEIKAHEARAGDLFLLKLLGSPKLNHGGLLISRDLLAHHLPGRLSRREPAGLWGRQAEKWYRWNA